jgi:hypothetical protein
MAAEHRNNLGGELCDKLFAVLKARIPDIDHSPLRSKCTFHRHGERTPVWVNVEHNSHQIHVRPLGNKDQVREAFGERGIPPARPNRWKNYEVGGTGDIANIGVIAEVTLKLLGAASGILPPIIASPEVTRFDFQPGCSEKASSTLATPAQGQLYVDLRHNEIQQELYRVLVSAHGKDNVGTEVPCGSGNRIDVVLRQGREYSFYEIKTADSARACIREAIGQLLDYAFWPGAQAAARLIVVGEPAIDSAGQEYLLCLRDRFSLRIEYQQLTVG